MAAVVALAGKAVGSRACAQVCRPAVVQSVLLCALQFDH